MYNKARRIKYRIYFLGTQRYQKHPIIRPDRLPNARTLHMLAHIRTVYTKPFRSGKRNWTNCVRIVCFFQLIPYFLLRETTKTFTSQNCWTNCPTVECFYPFAAFLSYSKPWYQKTLETDRFTCIETTSNIGELNFTGSAQWILISWNYGQTNRVKTISPTIPIFPVPRLLFRLFFPEIPTSQSL